MTIFLTSVRTLWELINAGSLAKLEPMIRPYAGGYLWDPLMVDDAGGAELESARLFRHPFPHAWPQEKAADRLRAALIVMAGSAGDDCGEARAGVNAGRRRRLLRDVIAGALNGR